jgi:hypothetical protein
MGNGRNRYRQLRAFSLGNLNRDAELIGHLFADPYGPAQAGFTTR